MIILVIKNLQDENPANACQDGLEILQKWHNDLASEIKRFLVAWKFFQTQLVLGILLITKIP